MGHKLVHVVLDVQTNLVEVVLHSIFITRNEKIKKEHNLICSFLTNVNQIEITHMKISGLKGDLSSILHYNSKFKLIFKDCQIHDFHKSNNFRNYEARGRVVFVNCY